MYISTHISRIGLLIGLGIVWAVSESCSTGGWSTPGLNRLQRYVRSGTAQRYLSYLEVPTSICSHPYPYPHPHTHPYSSTTLLFPIEGSYCLLLPGLPYLSHLLWKPQLHILMEWLQSLYYPWCSFKIDMNIIRPPVFAFYMIFWISCGIPFNKLIQQ